MTAKGLLDYLCELEAQGKNLEIPIYFDTCARTFEYHLAKIDSTFYQELYDGAKDAIILTEDW